MLGISLTLQRGRGRLSPPTPTTSSAGSPPTPALDRILTGLLDLDKLDQGIVELRREPVDLASLVAGVVSEAREELTAHPVSLDLLPTRSWPTRPRSSGSSRTCSPTPPATDPGTPIWVRVEPATGGRCSASTTPARASRPSSGSRSSSPSSAARVGHLRPGSGVGLALVAQIASLHDGQAWVEDRAGGGASFRVLLPGANGGA